MWDAAFFGTAAADFAFRANSVLFTFNTQAQLAQLDTDPINTFTRVNGLNYTGTLGGFWDLSVPFAFGQAFGLEAIITTSAFTLAGSNSTANSFANFGNSIFWGGITSVTLADGTTASAFSAPGNTGNDWKLSAMPATELSSTWLVLVGLGMLALLPSCRKPGLGPQGSVIL